MLNYNKIVRQSSNQKSRSKSILNNVKKSHTTSMNLRISADIMSDFSNIPLKNIIYRNQQKKYQQKYQQKQRQKYLDKYQEKEKEKDRQRQRQRQKQIQKQKYQQKQKYKLILNTNLCKEKKQLLRSDHKQSQKSKSNKKLKPLQQMTPQQIKLTSRGSFVQKSPSASGYKNNNMGLETQRFSRQKNWKKFSQKNQSIRFDRLMNKENSNRLKTDYLMGDQEENHDKIDAIQLSNIYKQMTSHQYPGQVSQRQFAPSSGSKSINLFNVKKQETFNPMREILNSSQKQVQLSVGELRFLVQKISKIKEQRDAIRRQIIVYRNVNKKQKINNSVFRALR